MKILLTKSQKFLKRHINVLSGRKFDFSRSLGKTIPRTNFETVITTKYPVPDCFPKFLRNGSLMLYREIRNASASIQMMRRCDGLSRATVDALSAFAASAASSVRPGIPAEALVEREAQCPCCGATDWWRNGVQLACAICHPIPALSIDSRQAA